MTTMEAILNKDFNFEIRVLENLCALNMGMDGAFFLHDWRFSK